MAVPCRLRLEVGALVRLTTPGDSVFGIVKKDVEIVRVVAKQPERERYLPAMKNTLIGRGEQRGPDRSCQERSAFRRLFGH